MGVSVSNSVKQNIRFSIWCRKFKGLVVILKFKNGFSAYLLFFKIRWQVGIKKPASPNLFTTTRNCISAIKGDTGFLCINEGLKLK